MGLLIYTMGYLQYTALWAKVGFTTLVAILIGSTAKVAIGAELRGGLASGIAPSVLIEPFRKSTGLSPHESRLVVAQIVPDASLGGESSVLVPELSVDGGIRTMIEGGATRDSNLFHSFQGFDILSGQQVYFASPAGIENIFSRVTEEGNSSRINGLLGVNGSANLYLLNPNGITFGENASLDIEGSLTVSTARDFSFADGSSFGISDLKDNSLLSVSAPLGVQFNEQFGSSSIWSEGNLAVGEDLNLWSGLISLERELVAGRDLTLYAPERIFISGTDYIPFLAIAGRDLKLQSGSATDIDVAFDIERLQLNGAGTLQDLARFQSGRDATFTTLNGTPGSISSRSYSPVIFAGRDVIFGDYLGNAFLIEAGGSIQGGDIVITDPAFGLRIDGSGPDADLLASTPSVILKAGSPPPNGPFPGRTAVDNALIGGITVKTINTSNLDGREGGSIILSATGDIVISESFEYPQPEDPEIPILLPTRSSLSAIAYSDSGNNPASNGGDILITSVEGNIRVGDIQTSSIARALEGEGNSGDVFISTNSGYIETETIDTFTFFSGRGGNISVESGSGHVSVNGSLTTSVFFGGQDLPEGGAGDVTVSSTSGNILIEGGIDAISRVDYGMPSDGGRISVISSSGNIVINDSIRSTSFMNELGTAGNGGDIFISANNGFLSLNSDFPEIEDFNLSIFRSIDSSAETPSGGIPGDGGNITLHGESGNISLGAINSTSFANADTQNGGDISIALMDGDISIRRLDSSSDSIEGNSRNGGDVSVRTGNGNISVGEINTFSFSSLQSGDGGDVSIFSPAGKVSLENINTLSSTESLGSQRFQNSPGSTGKGGDVSILARTIAGNDTSINTFSSSILGGSTREGGSVLLQGSFISDIEILTVSDTSTSGDVKLFSIDDELTINNVNLIVSGQVDIVNAFTGRTISLEPNRLGPAGNTSIIGTNGLFIEDSEFRSDANGPSNAGNFTITNSNTVKAVNSRILSGSNSIGAGGNIILDGIDVLVLDNSIIETNTNGQGLAGDISIGDTGTFVLYGDSLLLSDAIGNQSGGDININTEFMVAAPNSNSDIVVNAIDGTGGTVKVTSSQVFGFTQQSGLTTSQLRNNNTSDISASSQSGLQGEVTFNNIEPDPAQGLSELPLNLTDSSNQISEGCGANARTSGQSEFVTTGRGGLPDQPTAPSLATTDSIPWVTASSPEPFIEPYLTPVDQTSASEKLVEAQGWAIQMNGQVMFVEDTDISSNLYASGIPSGHCSASNY